MWSMLQNFSPIQNHILSKLKNAEHLRYSELQPEKVPNDLFNYHLQYLVKKDFVEKLEEGYKLSSKGMKHVADPYPYNNAITSLFKINVITIVSRVVDGQIEILNQVRKSNPSYGKVGVMGGVVLKGELIEHAASRKLKQETGLEATLKLVACERRVLYKEGEIFSDVMFPITYADTYTGELVVDSEFGHNMWVPIEQAIINESSEFDSIKSIKKILENIRDESLHSMAFFFEESIQTDGNLL